MAERNPSSDATTLLARSFYRQLRANGFGHELVVKMVNELLSLVAQESFGDSYARTLAEWRRRFNLAWPYLARHGFDERFQRLWNYYLAYCETGFRFRATDVSLFKLERR